jgi:hypothetical protein
MIFSVVIKYDMTPLLPLELLHIIGLSNSMAFSRLAQSHRAFLATLPCADVKSHFTTLQEYINTKYNNPFIKSTYPYLDTTGPIMCYRLPNGHIHSPGDLPAITTNKPLWVNNAYTQCYKGWIPLGMEVSFWYKDNMLHRDNELPAVVYGGGAVYYYEHDELQMVFP